MFLLYLRCIWGVFVLYLYQMELPLQAIYANGFPSHALTFNSPVCLYFSSWVLQLANQTHKTIQPNKQTNKQTHILIREGVKYYFADFVRKGGGGGTP